MTEAHEKDELNPAELYLFSQAEIPLEHGLFNVMVFKEQNSETETVVLTKGSLSNSKVLPLFVRVHSECFTGEVLHSLKCDCKNQLDLALDEISTNGHGAVIYLRQEGRGIGLGNKIKAYQFQNEGLNTIEANEALGFPNDLRSFTLAAKILKYLDILHIKLNTNNPDKIKELKNFGINVHEIIPSVTHLHNHNASYLKTKYQEMGHHLGDLFLEDTIQS